VITVVSTGYNAPTKEKCIASVEAQTISVHHQYIEASEQAPPRSVVENVYHAVQYYPADEIIVHLDGDDWFAHERVIERVAAMYRDGADCTYGSFRFNDGRNVALKAYENHKNCRKEPWLGTHLKTFRAGLLQRVPPGELMFEGEWINMACDMAIMLPVLELAEHAVFCSETLVIYNYASSWEHRFTNAERMREATIVRELRSRSPLR
jgi:hypothetical protein